MDFIPLQKVNITEQEIAEVVRVLKTGMLVQGKEVQALEQRTSEYLNVKHAIAASNGTATLHLALIALGIGVGDEVIIPAFSYIATANVVELVGAIPVFVDIDLHTFNIDCQKVEDKITARTKAIMPVHEFGLMSDMTAIIDIAKKHQLYVIEDAACALGASLHSTHGGTFGDIGSFSLHPRKAITSGEGGLLTTNNDELANKLRTLRNHGSGMVNGKAEFILPGLNYRLTDFQAAMVNSQFARLDSFLKKKTELAQLYHEKLSTSEFILLPSVTDTFKHTWQTYHIVIKDNNINRDEVIQQMKLRGVGTNYGAQCMPSQYYFQSKYGLDCETLFPMALKANRQGLALPIYDSMNLQQLEKVVECLFETLLNIKD